MNLRKGLRSSERSVIDMWILASLIGEPQLLSGTKMPKDNHIQEGGYRGPSCSVVAIAPETGQAYSRALRIMGGPAMLVCFHHQSWLIPCLWSTFGAGNTTLPTMRTDLWKSRGYHRYHRYHRRGRKYSSITSSALPHALYRSGRIRIESADILDISSHEAIHPTLGWRVILDRGSNCS